MTSTTSPANRAFRDARDRLIDHLGLGKTHPLRDLPLGRNGLIVPYGSVAKIQVESSQKDVVYSLRTPPESDAVTGVGTTGTGGTLTLETPTITTNLTYGIHAVKPSGLKAVLFETATVKVGLDLALPARILPLPGSDPRVADYGTTVTVELERSQDGVDYQLVTPVSQAGAPAEAVQSAVVRGTGGTIVLTSGAMQEDVVLRIRATKTFDVAGEPQRKETSLLTVQLPLYVRADPARAVTVPPIRDYARATSATVATAQASARYRAWTRPIADQDYRQGSTDLTRLFSIRVDGAPDALIAIPVLPAAGAALTGYTSQESDTPGTGANLPVPLPAAPEDFYVVIQALKTHRVPDGTTIATQVWLHAVGAALVRPDPDRALSAEARIENGMTQGNLRFSGGQPGIFYSLRPLPEGAEYPLPVYFHKRDATDARQNKGVGQVKLEVDLVVATEQPPASPELTPPQSLTARTVFAGRAVKAQTRVAVALTRPVAIKALA